MNPTAPVSDRSPNPFDPPPPTARRASGAGSPLIHAFWLVVCVAAFAAGWLLLGRHDSHRAAPVEAAAHQHGAGAAASESSAALWTCSMHPQVIEKSPGICPICHMELTPVDASASAGGTLLIDPVVVQNMGLRLAKVEKGVIARQLRVVGYLEEPEPLHRDINLRVGGWVERLYANVDGMDIAEGQPLFDLYSPELRGAIEELITARKMVAAGQPGAAAIRAGVERKLELMGLTPAQVKALADADEAPATVPILAPMTGHLTEKMVYEGAAVKAGELAMRLASRHKMWLDAQVYESQLPLIRVGNRVSATVEAMPGRSFEGAVVFIHPHLDPATRTALVRVELENPDLSLRQGMFATVTLETEAPGGELPLIPREALLDTGTRQVVFVALGEGRFEPRSVRVGVNGAGMVQVLEGLRPGETVVTSGQFLLDSESRIKEAIQKHLQTASAAPVGPAVTVPRTDEIVGAYLAVSRRLGARQTEDSPVDVAPLIEAARRAADDTPDTDARALASAVVATVEKMASLPLAEQRKAFLPVSEAVLALVDRSPPSTAALSSSTGARPVLRVAQCPMALDDRGAVWLQDAEELQNPYFATTMKRCGEFVRDVALRPGSKHNPFQ